MCLFFLEFRYFPFKLLNFKYGLGTFVNCTFYVCTLSVNFFFDCTLCTRFFVLFASVTFLLISPLYQYLYNLCVVSVNFRRELSNV